MVYVDDAKVLKYGHAWFHLMADSVTELHEFAVRIDLPARAFHRGARHPHYDVTTDQRLLALQHGAAAVSVREAVRIGRRVATPSRVISTDPPQLHLFA